MQLTKALLQCIQYKLTVVTLLSFGEEVIMLYSLRIVKEVVSDIDTVSRNNFDHYLIAIKKYKI